MVLLERLDVKYHVFAVARCSKKTAKPPDAADSLPCKPLCQRSERNCLDRRLDITILRRLFLPGLVFEPDINSGQTGWREPQGLGLCNTACQYNVVFHSFNESAMVI